jgi:cytochrome c-type biogenesis protein CcmE
VARTDEGATFTLAYGGAVAPVRHQGDLPQLFEPGIPVVLEGRWEGDRFESDRMLVKHSEVYTAENPERVGGYEPPGGGTGAEPAGAGSGNGADSGTGRP